MGDLPGGLWPAMYTPLTADGSPNPAMIEKLVELFVAQELDGIYLLGATGQGPGMTVDVRKQVAELTVKANGGRLPIVIHVGAIATADAIELAKHSADLGVEGVSSVPTIFFPTTIDVDFHHYHSIASATDLPFLPYYNAVSSGGFSVSTAEYVKRVLDIPHVVGMKLTSHDLYSFGLVHSIAKDRLLLYSGADELNCHATLSGAHGAIGTYYNVWGGSFKKMRQACIDGQFGASRDFMLTVQQVLDRIMASGRRYRFERQAIQLLHGIDIGPGVSPHCSAGDDWEDAEVLSMCQQVEAAAGLLAVSN